MHRGRLALVVDHMADFAVITQRHGNHVVEPFVRTDLLSMTHVAVLFVSRRVIV